MVEQGTNQPVEPRQNQSRVNRVVEGISGAAIVATAPLFAAGYVFESQLRPVYGPVELVLLTSLIAYLAAKANR